MAAKVLVVEDDKFLTEAYTAKLTKAGFTVEIAIDGDEALAKLATFKPDAVVLDLLMPRKDGFAVLEEMKKQEAYKNIPVLVATNLGQKDAVDRAKALGAADYIIKTNLSMDELSKKLTDLIK